jgi:hypothetical protein
MPASEELIRWSQRILQLGRGVGAESPLHTSFLPKNGDCEGGNAVLAALCVDIITRQAQRLCMAPISVVR